MYNVYSPKYITETATPSGHWDTRLSQDPETKVLIPREPWMGSGAIAGDSSNGSDIQGFETQERRSKLATKPQNTRPPTFPDPHLGN